TGSSPTFASILLRPAGSNRRWDKHLFFEPTTERERAQENVFCGLAPTQDATAGRPCPREGVGGLCVVCSEDRDRSGRWLRRETTMKSRRRHFVTASALGAAGMIARSQLIAADSGAPQSSSRTETPTGASGSYRQVDAINWYYELRGRGPTVVLIPSGEGD